MVAGKEVTCGVLEDERGSARALPPTLIVPSAADWYDFKVEVRAVGERASLPGALRSGLSSGGFKPVP